LRKDIQFNILQHYYNISLAHPFSNKTKINVFFDSNQLFNFSKETAELKGKIVDGIGRLTLRFKDYSNIEIKLNVPDTVVHEGLYAFSVRVKEINKLLQLRIDNLEKMGIQVKDFEIPENINDTYLKQLTEYKFEIIKPEYSNIDVESLMHDGAAKIAPFEPGNEKGFRDSLIIYTLRDFAKSCSEKIVFVCNDKKLLEGLKRILTPAEYEKVSIVNSLEELEGYLNLEEQKITKEISKIISKQAENFFEVRVKEAAEKELNEKYEETLNKPYYKGPTILRKIGSGSYKLVDDYYLQDSTYFSPPTYISFSNSTKVAKFETKVELRKIHKDRYGSVVPNLYKFTVMWEAKVSDKKRLVNKKIKDIKFEGVEETTMLPSWSSTFLQPPEEASTFTLADLKPVTIYCLNCGKLLSYQDMMQKNSLCYECSNKRLSNLLASTRF